MKWNEWMKWNENEMNKWNEMNEWNEMKWKWNEKSFIIVTSVKQLKQRHNIR